MDAETDPASLLFVGEPCVGVDPDRPGLDEPVTVRTADGLPSALAVLGEHRVDCVVTAADLDVEEDGLAVVHRVRDRHDDLPVVLVAETPGEDLVTEAFRAGATDVIRGTDPGATARLTKTVGRAVDRRRERRERELEVYESAVNTAGDAIYQLDAEGRFRMVNDAVTDLTGYDRDALLGEHVRAVMPDEEFPAGRRHVRELAENPASGAVVFESEVERVDGDRVPVETRVTALSEGGRFSGTVGVVRDISDRREHERTLTALHEVTGNLLRAETDGAVADHAVSAAEDLFALEGVGVYRFDADRNRLEPVAVSQRTTDLVGEAPEFGPGDSIAWDVFVEGEQRVCEDVRASPNVYDPATPFRTEVFLPLGEYGVMIAGSTDRITVDERTEELLEILGANCEAALARVARERTLRERERTLAERNEQLRQHRRVNDRIRRLANALVGAETRTEIAELVCERLTEVEWFTFAWVGELDPVEAAVVPTAWSGTGADYLDELDTSAGSGNTDPGVAAAFEGEKRLVETVARDLRSEPWRQAALSRDFRSAAAVPLVYDGVQYGVLSVYADRTDGFSETTRGVLAELGATVAYAMNTVERRAALLADGAVELEFEVPAAGKPLLSLAADLECSVAFEAMLPGSDGTGTVYATVAGASVEELQSIAADGVVFENLRVVGETGGGQRVELRVTGETVPEIVTNLGGRLSRLTVGDGVGRVLVTLPETADVGSFVDRFTEAFPEADLYARRRETFEPTAGSGASDPLGTLTPRQREALTAAYYGGFFEWPRESTGEEVAATLDVAPPTFQEHLRHAERKLLAELVETELPRRPADD